MRRPGASFLYPHRFSFELNSVETKLKYPPDLIANQVSKVEIEYGQKESFIHVSITEDEKGEVSSFLRTMLLSDRSLAAQQFKATLTYYETQDRTPTRRIVVEDVWMTSFQTMGLRYSGFDDPVDNQIVLSFLTATLSEEA